MSSFDEKRFAILPVGYEFMAELFKTMLKGWPTSITMPMFKGIPEDTQIVSVTDEPFTRRFMILLTSMSFAPVKDGDVIPMYGGDRVIQMETRNLVGGLRFAGVSSKWSHEWNRDNQEADTPIITE